MTYPLNADEEDVRDFLRDDRDGSRAYALVQALVARSKEARADAAIESDQDIVAKTNALAEALMIAANTVERLAPRLRS